MDPPPPDAVSGVDRDLATLCLRCLEKEPERRLASARELVDELKRWSNGEPIHSRRISQGERMVKWARLSPFQAAMICAFALFALGSILAITWQWREAKAAAEMERRTSYAARLAQALGAREHHDFGLARRLLESIDPDQREGLGVAAAVSVGVGKSHDQIMNIAMRMLAAPIRGIVFVQNGASASAKRCSGPASGCNIEVSSLSVVMDLPQVMGRPNSSAHSMSRASALTSHRWPPRFGGSPVCAGIQRTDSSFAVKKVVSETK